MKRFFALCLMAVAFATAPAFADLQKGWNAYNNGDYKTALREFQPLAEQGDKSAQLGLGMMYQDGEGVPQDYKEAIKWFTLAVEQGHVGAQFFLGSIYFNGEGVSKDNVRAHMWFNTSASNGDELAAEIRDSLEKILTPEEIEKAQGLARACVAKDYKGC